MQENGAVRILTTGTRLAQRLGMDTPATLVVQGNLDWDAPMVAVVGTRRPDAYGTEMTRLIAEGLASVGITIVSGGAIGIDALAHRAAIEAGGKTLVFPGGGLAVPHPAQNTDLFNEIAAQHGAVASEVPIFMHAYRSAFLKRNRLIAGISNAVVVIQAGARSGALNTAGWARKYGVPLFTLPSDVWYQKSVGSLALLSTGAIPLTSLRDIAKAPGLEMAAKCTRWPQAGHRQQGSVPPWIANFGKTDGQDPIAEKILAEIRKVPMFIEEIADKIDLPPGRIQAIVLDLEMDGHTTRLPEGRIAATRTYLFDPAD